MTTKDQKTPAQKHGPETQAYIEWYNKEREKGGLLDVKFSVRRGICSTEGAFRVLNYCHNAKAEPADIVFQRKPSR